MVLLGLVGLAIAYGVISSYVNGQVEKGIQQRKAQIEAKEMQERVISTQHAEAERQRTEALAATKLAQIKSKQDELARAQSAFASSYIKGRQWLAAFIAEAFAAQDEATARALTTKKNPAHKAADEVRRIGAEKKELATRLKYLEYALKTYHEYYPALEQYSDDILNEAATLDLEGDDDTDTDRVSRYISKEEYARLSPTARNQLALDNWKARKKSNVEIGRIYERYLGYLYEKDGWAVTYIGAIAGLEDMGRDLLCVKGDAVHVVQAKYWSKHKTIHEKHIFQLYGTTILLPLTHPDLRGRKIEPVFAATTGLSETAVWAATKLHVEVRRLAMDQNYPLIKCNVNGSNRIYHLPFDQQYDRVRIIPSKGECYAKTTSEAEALGFRRAMRHTGFSS
jgi:hypothetical protein